MAPTVQEIDPDSAQQIQWGADAIMQRLVWRIYQTETNGGRLSFGARPIMVDGQEKRVPVILYAETVEQLRERLPAGLRRLDPHDALHGACLEAWTML